MPIQRSQLGRRAFLGLAIATSGCATVLSRSASRVSVLAAGSLQPVMDALQSRTDARVEAEAMGSAAAARLVASESRDPDVLALADTALFDDEAWYARIGTNALSVAYTSDTQGGQAIATADPWFAPILDGRATLGRTDPDLDPLGYRTLFMAGLAAEYYDRPSLRSNLFDEDQVYPETGLLSQFETGGVDAAIVYRSMAVDREYPTLDLPARVDLSERSLQDHYSQQPYTLPDGTTVRGDVIDYGARVRTDSSLARSVFETLTDGELLTDHGFTVPDRYPMYVGDVPETLG